MRVQSIDLVRGVIIVVMALDHVRDFFGDLAARPTDLSRATAVLFFTRWITNICAPVLLLDLLIFGLGQRRGTSRRCADRLSR
jgi:uncharacterized membrane protein